METSTETETTIRMLGLGNEILADDALGILVAREVERRFGHAVEVVTSSESGFNLIDRLLGASRLLVVDAIVTGKAIPGTIYVFEDDRACPVPGLSPHFVGLFEVLAVARKLRLPVPRQVTIFAVEGADCSTVGGAMNPDVQSAVPMVTNLVGELLASLAKEVARDG